MHSFEWKDFRSDAVYGAMRWVAHLRDAERDPERKTKLDTILRGLVPPDLIRILGSEARVAEKAQEARKFLAERGLLPRALRSLVKWCLNEIERTVHWYEKGEARHAETQ
ncbi:MAG: hypothetical protein ACPLPR_01565 [Bacillota bacterium]